MFYFQFSLFSSNSGVPISAKISVENLCDYSDLAARQILVEQMVVNILFVCCIIWLAYAELKAREVT